MNEKGKKTLEKICEYFNPLMIKAVVCSRDTNVINDYYDEIRTICKKNNIDFVDRLNEDGIFNEDYRLAIGWRWMIPSKERLLIFHDSILPKYRGFAPLVNALINGEHEIGASVLLASDDFDRGNIVAQKKISITYPITIAEAISKISILYQDLAIEVIDAIHSASLIEVAQNEMDSTYSVWRDEEDYHINWNDSAEEIVRFINAVGYPYEGAFSFVDGKKVRILEAEVHDNLKLELKHVGKVLCINNNLPVVITGDGMIKIKQLYDVDGNNLLPLKRLRIRFK